MCTVKCTTEPRLNIHLVVLHAFTPCTHSFLISPNLNADSNSLPLLLPVTSLPKAPSPREFTGVELEPAPLHVMYHAVHVCSG